MILIVKRKETCEVHLVTQSNTTEGTTLIWAEGWPGIHKIGEDCEWEKMTDERWRWVCFIRENPEMTMKRLAKDLKIDTTTIWRFIKRYKLNVRMVRPRGEQKKAYYYKKKPGKWYFGANNAPCSKK